MMTKDIDIIEGYIDSLPEEAVKNVSDVISIIYEAAPYAEAKLNYGVLAFALIPGGKRDTQIMVGGYKKHTGFYPHPDTISHFEDKLMDFKHAKGSVQFPNDKPLPKELIREMVLYRQAVLNLNDIIKDS